MSSTADYRYALRYAASEDIARARHRASAYIF